MKEINTNISDVENNNFEPKLNNRFVVYVGCIPTHLIHSIRRPLICPKNEKYIYSDLELHIYETAQPNTSDTAMHNIIKNNIIDVGDIKLHQLGPVGDIISETVYKNCKIIQIEYPTLAWSDASYGVIKILLSFTEVSYL